MVHDSTAWQLLAAAIIVTNFAVTVYEAEVDPTKGLHATRWYALDVTFNLFFLVELLVNVLSHTPREFLRSPNALWNIFDTAVVITGMLAVARIDTGPLSDIKTLRAFRILRLFRRVPALNKMTTALVRAIPATINALILLLLSMCIFAILAVEFFQDFGMENGLTFTTMDYIGSYPNTTLILRNVSSMTERQLPIGYEYYGTFSRALYTLFQVLTTESWAENVARPLLFGYKDTAVVAIFFTVFLLLNQVILVNVVIAVLLDGFIVEPSPESDFDALNRQVSELLAAQHAKHGAAPDDSKDNHRAAQERADRWERVRVHLRDEEKKKLPELVQLRLLRCQVGEMQDDLAEVQQALSGVLDSKARLERVLAALQAAPPPKSAVAVRQAARGGDATPQASGASETTASAPVGEVAAVATPRNSTPSDRPVAGPAATDALETAVRVNPDSEVSPSVRPQETSTAAIESFVASDSEPAAATPASQRAREPTRNSPTRGSPRRSPRKGSSPNSRPCTVS